MKEVVTLYRAGRLQEADQAARHALAKDPKNIQLMNLLGAIAHDVGRNDLAVQWYERAIRVDPSQWMLYNNLGETYRAMAQGDLAISAYQAAIQRQPQAPEPRNNLAIVLTIQGHIDAAMAVWREVLEMQPDNALAANNLGNAHLDRGEAEEGAQWHRRAIEIDPTFARAHSNLLRDLQYLPGTTPRQLLEEHRAWWRLHGTPSAPAERVYPNVADPDRPLRIGWVSGDFREHSVAYFLEPIFERHDRAAFQFVAYSCVPAEDSFTARFKAHAEQWRSIIGLRLELVDRQIRGDGIDILVDLGGHTAGQRAPLFAFAPAPVQVSYLGYASTTGIETIDYRMTDSASDPPGECESHYTEKLVRLPRCAWCYRPMAHAPAVSSLPARRNGYITFGSFNHFSKVNANVTAAWAQILGRVPNARLLLKANGLGEASIQERVRATFQSAGIACDRIIMAGREPTAPEHLGRYGEIDIALDTFPYNGTTTTCEALWMGVPVVALAGAEHRSRVGVSLLSALGLERLIGKGIDDYVRIAAELAGSLNELAELRAACAM